MLLSYPLQSIAHSAVCVCVRAGACVATDGCIDGVWTDRGGRENIALLEAKYIQTQEILEGDSIVCR